jgi:hypothetical protein
MTVQRATKGLARFLVLSFFATAAVNAQSLADAARKEKERREKAGATTAPSFTDEDLKKEGASSESPKSGPSPAPRASSTRAPADHDEAWWRAQAAAKRSAVARAEAEVKRYEQLVEEARTGIRQPLPIDGVRQVPPRRVATDAEKRSAEAGLAASRLQLAEATKAMDDLEDEARRKQILPGWLR